MDTGLPAADPPESITSVSTPPERPAPATPPPLPVPTLPRVRAGLPVLRRGTASVQFGLTAGAALVVEGLSPALVALCLRLDSRASGGGLVPTPHPGVAPRAEPPAALAFLDWLARHGVLEDAGPATPDPAGDRVHATGPPGRPPALRDARVLVRGDGPLAPAVAVELARGGVGRVRVAAKGTVRPEDTTLGYRLADVGRDRTNTANALVAEAVPGVRTGVLAPGTPDLVVLADVPLPDPVAVRELMADGVPHLPARVWDGVGVVGPLVVPGRTSCLRCADLTRTDADPCWPLLAAQLAERPVPVDGSTGTATAALAASQCLLALDRGASPRIDRPRVWNTTLELDLRFATLQARAWEPHPRCGCRPAVDRAGTTRSDKPAEWVSPSGRSGGQSPGE